MSCLQRDTRGGDEHGRPVAYAAGIAGTGARGSCRCRRASRTTTVLAAVNREDAASIHHPVADARGVLTTPPGARSSKRSRARARDWNRQAQGAGGLTAHHSPCARGSSPAGPPPPPRARRPERCARELCRRDGAAAAASLHPLVGRWARPSLVYVAVPGLDRAATTAPRESPPSITKSGALPRPIPGEHLRAMRGAPPMLRPEGSCCTTTPSRCAEGNLDRVLHGRARPILDSPTRARTLPVPVRRLPLAGAFALRRPTDACRARIPATASARTVPSTALGSPLSPRGDLARGVHLHARCTRIGRGSSMSDAARSTGADRAARRRDRVAGACTGGTAPPRGRSPRDAPAVPVEGPRAIIEAGSRGRETARRSTTSASRCPEPGAAEHRRTTGELTMVPGAVRDGAGRAPGASEPSRARAGPTWQVSPDSETTRTRLRCCRAASVTWSCAEAVAAIRFAAAPSGARSRSVGRAPAARARQVTVPRITARVHRDAVLHPRRGRDLAGTSAPNDGSRGWGLEQACRTRQGPSRARASP